MSAANTDPPPSADDGYAGMPKWVKWSLLAVLALVVILVLVRLLSGGDHGPGRHMSAPGPSAVAGLTGH